MGFCKVLPAILNYYQTSNISCTSVGNKIVDHSDVVGASPVGGRCSNYIFILDLTPGFKGLDKDNYKIRRETFRFWDLVWILLEFWQYIVWSIIGYLKSLIARHNLKNTAMCNFSASMVPIDSVFIARQKIIAAKLSHDVIIV